MVVIVATIFFSGISGSSAADTAAIGSIMIPSMVNRGYPRPLATAIVASAGGMGILIPPCITMIIFALTANVSVGYLFAAGFVPGALMGLSLMVMVYLVARKQGLPSEPRTACGGVFRAFIAAVPPLVMPIIILGGILSGVFTATESAVVAVIYGMFLSMFVYRELHLKDVPGIMVASAKLTGVVMLLLGMCSTFAWLLATQQIPQMIASSMLSVSSSPLVFFLLVNILFLFVGCFMDATPAIIILVPILFPVATKLGIDPIHFGTVLVANLGIGFITPPVGTCLYVAASIGKCSIEDLAKPLLPFLGMMIVTLMIITYIPDVVLFIPRMTGYVR
jgi:C4-dicarboxylate transporter DctM subunit